MGLKIYSFCKTILQRIVCLVITNTCPESGISNLPPELVQNHGAFAVGEPIIKYLIYPGGVGHIHTSRRRTLDRSLSGIEPIGKINHSKALIRQSRHIGSPTFVEPGIFPRSAGDMVAKPLVSKLMCLKAKAKIRHKRHGLMLHTTTPTKLNMSIFFFPKRIGCNQRIIELQNL